MCGCEEVGGSDVGVGVEVCKCVGTMGVRGSEHGFRGWGEGAVGTKGHAGVCGAGVAVRGLEGVRAERVRGCAGGGGRERFEGMRGWL